MDILKILAIVISVPTGDTVVVSVDGQERRIVLAGIDAPEPGQPHFEEARKGLADKVEGKKVFLQVFGRDGQGVQTAAVWLDERSINTEMVAEGHAWYDPRHPEYKTIIDAQKKAQEGKLGLWSGDRPTPPWEFAKRGGEEGPEAATTRELALDDGKPAGKKSFPKGHAHVFESSDGEWYLTSIRVHGARYGAPEAPNEDFHITVCDKNYLPIKDYTFPYATFERTVEPDWVVLKLDPVKVPEKFVICLNFNAEATKGVYISHDAEGTSLVALPDKPAGIFTGGHWLIRPTLARAGAVPEPPAEKEPEPAPEPAADDVPELGEPRELALDDGNPAGKKSFPQGHATKFEAPEGDWWLASVRIHGARYGMPQPPKEDFHVTLCDKDFKPIRDFTFPYSRFARGETSKWVSLRIPPTKVPKDFVICLNFNAERTKGVYVSHDAEGTGLVGLPGQAAGSFTGGDWLIRPTLKPAK